MVNAVLWMERTKIDLCDYYLLRQKCSAHPLGQCVILLLGIVTAPDARLVGHHYNKIIAFGCGTTKIEYAIDEFEFLGPTDVAAINVDHAVPIQKQRLSLAAHLSIFTDYLVPRFLPPCRRQPNALRRIPVCTGFDLRGYI